MGFAVALLLAVAADAAGSGHVPYRQPSVFVDGAFSHRPFSGGAYGFIHGAFKERYVIPDQSGLFSGQETWVDIARCCARTPKSSDIPMDDAQSEGERRMGGQHSGPCTWSWCAGRRKP